MKRKKPKIVDSEYEVLFLNARHNCGAKWKADHCYNYGWSKKDVEPCVVFLINLYAPTKSGYIMEKAKQMWRKPMVIAEPDRAFVAMVAPQDIFEYQMRRQMSVPKYYVVIVIPKEEATKWYGNLAAGKDLATEKVHGQIQYF